MPVFADNSTGAARLRKAGGLRYLTVADFRRIALSLDGAEEGSHMGSPDFRVGGRIFATLASQKLGYGNLLLTPEVQAQFVAEEPDVFVPVAGGWGRNGATHVVLKKANEDLLTGALRTAWKLRQQKNAATRRTKQALLVVAAFGLSLPAFACECVSIGGGPCPRVPESGDMVAVGTVVSKELIRTAPVPSPVTGDSNRRPAARLSGSPVMPAPIVRVTLSVSESFRGNPGNTVVVQTDNSDCAYPFEVGHAYLVFAERIQGALRVHKCTATRPAKMAATTIQQLRARRDRTALPDLFGFAGTHSADTSEFGWEQIEPVPGLTVTAESNGREYRTRTADDGAYAFQGMPRGYYHVSVAAPPGRVVLPAQTGMEAGPETCPLRFEVYYDGRISGTITGPDGPPSNGYVFVTFERPNKLGTILVGGQLKNGTFEIPRLGPGSYRLVYNGGAGNLIYYPGTRVSSQATPIELDDGTHIDGLQFRIF